MRSVALRWIRRSGASPYSTIVGTPRTAKPALNLPHPGPHRVGRLLEGGEGKSSGGAAAGPMRGAVVCRWRGTPGRAAVAFPRLTGIVGRYPAAPPLAHAQIAADWVAWHGPGRQDADPM